MVSGGVVKFDAASLDGLIRSGKLAETLAQLPVEVARKVETLVEKELPPGAIASLQAITKSSSHSIGIASKLFAPTAADVFSPGILAAKVAGQTIRALAEAGNMEAAVKVLLGPFRAAFGSWQKERE